MKPCIRRPRAAHIASAAALFLLLAPVLTGCAPLVNQMAFYPDRTYRLPHEQLPHDVKPISIAAEHQPTLAAYFLPSERSGKLLIYFHGNAGNLDYWLPTLIRLRDMGVNVLGVEYRGFGRSEGSPSEHGLYADGEAAWTYATQTLGYRPEDILLVGRSIGTTVATHVAAARRPGGLILVSPMTDAKSVVRSLGLIALLAGNAFDNLARCPDIAAPTLVIHGTDDRIIPAEMGALIFDAIPASKRFVLIRGAGHIRLDKRDEYWEAIEQFVSAARASARAGSDWTLMQLGGVPIQRAVVTR